MESSSSRLIMKYANRRLYDTVEHRYLTLEDIRQMVLDNREFVVRDRKDQSDITLNTLLNVLLQAQDDRPAPLLNRKWLIDTIRTHGQRRVAEQLEPIGHTTESVREHALEAPALGA